MALPFHTVTSFSVHSHIRMYAHVIFKEPYLSFTYIFFSWKMPFSETHHKIARPPEFPNYYPKLGSEGNVHNKSLFTNLSVVLRSLIETTYSAHIEELLI